METKVSMFRTDAIQKYFQSAVARIYGRGTCCIAAINAIVMNSSLIFITHCQV